VHGNYWIEDTFAMALQARQRAGFVAAHHAGIANDIGREDGREAPIGLVAFGHARIGRGYSSAAPAVGNCAGTRDVAFGSKPDIETADHSVRFAAGKWTSTKHGLLVPRRDSAPLQDSLGRTTGRDVGTGQVVKACVVSQD
jgi:hypothetical protein